MKKIVTLSLLSLSLLVATSCNDLIDKEPIDQISASTLFDSEQNAKGAVTSIYRSLESPYYYGQAFMVVPEFAAQHLRHTASYPEYVEYTENRIRIDNVWSLNLWTAMYATINATNLITENVPGMTSVSSENVKLQMIREAKFLRALTYFNLVRSFGDVPLITTPTVSASPESTNVSRTPAAEVYAKIIEDLTDATLLPVAYSTTEETKGRATQYAAKALLAKVYLYLADYARAASYAKDVIENGGYTLTQDYPSIWQTENSSESIFELQFDQQATNPLVGGTTWNGATLFFAQDKTVDLFEAGDIRKNFSIYTTNGKFYVGKYRNYNPATQNLTLIRLSEIYLIYAEAAARANQAAAGEPYTYYKSIRDRAQVGTSAETSFTDLAAFVRAVQEEKRRELIFEGEAWYDYTRTGLALTEMMVVPDAKRYLFPIPQSERNLNTQLSQNSAYQ